MLFKQLSKEREVGERTLLQQWCSSIALRLFSMESTYNNALEQEQWESMLLEHKHDMCHMFYYFSGILFMKNRKIKLINKLESLFWRANHC